MMYCNYCFSSLFHPPGAQLEEVPDDLLSKLSEVHALKYKDVFYFKKKIVFYAASKLIWREIVDLVYTSCLGCECDSLTQARHTCVYLWTESFLKNEWADTFFTEHFEQALVSLDWGELKCLVKSITDLFDAGTDVMASPKFWRTREAMRKFKQGVHSYLINHATGNAYLPMLRELCDDLDSGI